MTSVREAPYFDRRSTHELIADLAITRDWTIYLGSGATIDRTGLTWKRLVDRLLTRFETDAQLRSAIIDRHGEIRAATIVHNLYSRLVDGDKQLAEDIRRLLYEGQRHMKGRLLDYISEFAISLANQGASVTFVTPNYDDYLLFELWSHFANRVSDKSRDPKLDVQLKLLVPPLKREDLPSGWDSPKGIVCAFIHGFLPRPGLSELIGVKEKKLVHEPVFSEPQYFSTYQRSLSILSQLFADRNVLLLGTGVTDPPLVNALLATKPSMLTASRLRRLAILPLQSGEFYELERPADSSRLAEWNTKRLNHLGASPVYPDFYTQVGQLIHEAQMCVEHGDRATMVQAVAPRRYGSRLVSWWNSWFSTHCGTTSSQARHSDLLAGELLGIRTRLRAPIDENLKLEAWIRWHPASRRELALWASSVGTWPDIWSMRRDEISTLSDYKSVQVFCNGAPTFLHVDQAATDRWRSYLATPIWLDSPEGDLPVGVISLASMKLREEGSVGAHNLSDIDTVLTRMRNIGERIVATS